MHMKTIKQAQDSILADIPKENWPIAGDVQQELFKAWNGGEDFTIEVEKIRQRAIKRYGKVLYSIFQFQIENGYLAEGNFEIVIQLYLAKIVSHRITPAVKLLIEVHGGIEIKEEKKTKNKKQKREEVKANDSTST